ncbi:MAG: cytochrome c-type biogenesis CcmF C-terminal domain-containing protein [Alphaproteobacteria bacterium]|nr:cytochrome c-type biogenesis CcmF C-terminal domain-containing protein [Alphaproteobacteria bacterium]
MIGEIGNLFLALALGFLAVQVGASFWGVQRENSRYLILGKAAAYMQGILILTAFITLMLAFLFCDFSLLTVVLNDHTQLPWYYRLGASWGNHEGSLLLFVLILSLVAVALSLFLKDPSFRARTLTFQGLLIFCFLVFLLMTSNPFTLLPFPLPEGQSLNPLLQDKSLMIHPPFLYLGYVGFSAPFSLALAALWGKSEGEAWATLTRPWALFAWAALTIGITLGSWWAYYELGWGGWWFWDPVENASLMPWLAGTALLHVLRTNAFYRWSLLLSLLTFGFSLLGTFLVRSGLIASVHSFAQDPERGLFILSLIGGIMGFSLFLWVWRSPRFKHIKKEIDAPRLDRGVQEDSRWIPRSSRGTSKQTITPVNLFSRKGLLFLNSLLLFVGLITLCFGTLYPLLSEGLWNETVAVGAPYFNQTLLPLLLPALLLIPVGALLREENTSLFQLLILPLTAGLGAIVFLLYIYYPLSLGTILGCGLAIWVLTGSLEAFFKGRLRLGPTLAHVGVALSLLGISVGSGLRVDEAKILGLNESLTIGSKTLTLQDVTEGKTPTYLYEKATLVSGENILTPEKRLYQPQNSLLSETAILTNGFSDLYVILGPYQGEKRWLFRASLIPLAPWIWIGGFLMAVGALISLLRRKEVLLILLAFLLIPHDLNATSDLYKEVRCPVCAGQSIADSEMPEAIALRKFISDELEKGKSAEAIREELRQRFGDDILFRPPFNQKTVFLWGLPFALFFFVLLGFLWRGFQSRAK